jgi:hypothetical protein
VETVEATPISAARAIAGPRRPPARPKPRPMKEALAAKSPTTSCGDRWGASVIPGAGRFLYDPATGVDSDEASAAESLILSAERRERLENSRHDILTGVHDHRTCLVEALHQLSDAGDTVNQTLAFRVLSQVWDGMSVSLEEQMLSALDLRDCSRSDDARNSVSSGASDGLSALLWID